MKAPSSTPRSLLIHDGELTDVHALLVSLRIPFVERIGAENADDRARPWELVIASARRILELQLNHSPTPPTQIAILSHDARTLRSSLRRTGTTLMVRRPVHPAALRALVVHSLYRGPEKRRSARVNVGAHVRLKIGWRHHDALLLDLSVTGCRLLTKRPLDRGKSFRLELPTALAGGRPLAVEARVVQCNACTDPGLGQFVTSASFAAVGARLHAQLQAAVAAHAEGPAVCEGAPCPAPAPVATEAPLGSPAQAVVVACVEETADEPVTELDDISLGGGSLDEEAARVLMGRDLTRVGMRVNANPSLAAGMKLRLAVHAETREMPLVLHAVVDRDEGERGLVLRFQDLTEELTRYLDYVMHALPLVIDDDDDEGCLITELIEAT